jgi:hypothetical protein
LTVAVTWTVELFKISVLISTFVSGNGWHNGIRLLVFLAAKIPAIRAVHEGSPFEILPSSISRIVSGFRLILPVAVASRKTSGLFEMSIIVIIVSPAFAMLTNLRVDSDSFPFCFL